jgi:hypothetical protein
MVTQSSDFAAAFRNLCSASFFQRRLSARRIAASAHIAMKIDMIGEAVKFSRRRVAQLVRALP